MVLLWPFEKLYILVISIRNTYYDCLYKAPNKDTLPIVISVGNLSAGGTGKTPVCLYLYELLKPNFKCWILLRGYTNKPGQVSDEATIYQNHIGKENVCVGSDRLTNIIKAKNNNIEISILDDAFQHRKVFRHLNIVLIDMTKPAYKDHCFPRGLLREPTSSLKRADWVILNRCNLVSDNELSFTISELRSDHPHLNILKSQVQMSALNCVNLSFSTQDDTSYLLVCGIGNPDNFRQSAVKENMNIADELIYPDHHAYTDNDIRQISHLFKQCNAEAILTTEKDWVKLSHLEIGIPVVVFEIKIEISDLENKPIKNGLINLINVKMQEVNSDED